MNPKIKRLEKKRAKLLQEAEAFKQADGSFKDDQARAAFDQKTTEIEAVDVQIRALTEPDDDEDDDDLATGADAVTHERARCLGIRQSVRAAKLDDTFADDLIRKGTSLEGARGLILDKLTNQDEATRNNGAVAIVPGEDARDKFFRGASAWLIQKAGLSPLMAKAANVPIDKLDSPGEFRGMSLLDLGRESLERAGEKVRGLSKMELAARALTFRAITQSTSDFAVLLENTMHKVLQAAYATQPDTWQRFCARGSVSDFRPHNRYRMGMFGRLDTLTANGEFKNKPILDAEKALISVATVGNIINLSRQAIVNDDMDAFSRLATMLGRAGKLSVEIDVYALLALNAGLGPTQADGQPLFHSNRANVGVGAAISVNALDADRVVMAIQKDPWGNEYLALRPAVLLVNVGQGGEARVINDAQYDPDTANRLQRPNKVRGLFSDIVDTPRVASPRRYLFADPSVAPVIEVAFLDGQSEPVLESRDGWRVDGVEWKVRLDYGVKEVDYRGAVTNAGA